MEFEAFGKISRLTRQITVTEKIDGTNGCIVINESEGYDLMHPKCIVARSDGLEMFVGSRSRWITSADDNYGFARWCEKNAEELFLLGPGRHFGEWWGSGIQRGYGQTQKRFSLFNTSKWSDDRPACCDVVPVLYDGIFDEFGVMTGVNAALKQLAGKGSVAAPGFMKPEGICIYHHASNSYFKKTLDKDEEWKGKSA